LGFQNTLFRVFAGATTRANFIANNWLFTPEAMEYTFRNSPRSEACTVILTESAVMVRAGGAERSISYDSILQVQMLSRKQQFQTTLYTLEGESLVITSCFFNEQGVAEDHARAYATWVRVLHFHLKDKSKAVFFAGVRFSKLGLAMLMAVALSFAISVVASYQGIGLGNPWVEGAVLAALAAAVIAVANKHQWPRSYEPTAIPLEYLP
jgi:hypothetical protein